MELKERKYDINDRLIDFAVNIIKLCESIGNSRAGVHMASQLLRSGTSPSLNYGEAMSAESRSDFIHKLKIALKELRETKNNILIIQKANLSTNKELMMFILKECSELIAILVKSTETAQKNKLNTKQ
jgi:four helix bundle protein